MWQITEYSNLFWCNAGPTSYVGQSSTYPMTLKSNISGLHIFSNNKLLIINTIMDTIKLSYNNKFSKL